MATVGRAIVIFFLLSSSASAADRLSILAYASADSQVDRTGKSDASPALTAAILAANALTSRGLPACIYFPPGTYRISTAPPAFVGAGCVTGDGPSQSILKLDPSFAGDLFSWSEAWIVTTPGPQIVGLKVVGSRKAPALQNAFVFYDRNDQVFIDNVDVVDLHGRALYSGAVKNSPQAYMRESHMRSLRFFRSGAPGVPVVEFSSQGSGHIDATNEIRMSQVDIYGSFGPSFVIRNEGSGGVRNITIDALRIEGLEEGNVAGDLLTIGDPTTKGIVSNITLTNLELIDPYKGFAALRMTAPQGSAAPYQITVQGSIGGGTPAGQGLRIDAGRSSMFRFSAMHTLDTNIVIGRGVTGIVLDGGGQEAIWTYNIDPTSTNGVSVPLLRSGIPSTMRGPAK